jgi:hypothetical protein
MSLSIKIDFQLDPPLAQRDQWDEKRCQELANAIDRLAASARSGLKGFNDFGEQFESARENNVLSLAQTGAFAAWGLLKTAASFVANAAKVAPVAIGGGKGFIPTGVSIGEGVVGVNNASAFSATVSAGRKGGIAFYGGTAAGNSGTDVAGLGANQFFNSVQRILDPLGRLAEVQIEAADFGSQDLFESLQHSRDVQGDLQNLYKENCP